MEPVVTFATPDELAGPGTRDFYLGILSHDEKMRLARLLAPAKQELFLLAHGLLRTSLSRCEDVEPAGWRFTVGEHGRPEIAAPKSALRFNLSHTQGLAACVVTDRADVGIDVEKITPRHHMTLARRFFSPREQHDLCALPEPEQTTRFFELWTLKEAYLKARGLGLTVPLRTFSFCRNDDAEWRIEFASETKDDPDRWRFRSWRVAPLHQAALAVAAMAVD